MALKQAHELAKVYNITIVSDEIPDIREPGIKYMQVKSHRFYWLRRYGHVPREIAFALSAKFALTQLHKKKRIDGILCHGHPVAVLSCVPLKKQFNIPYALVTHGDITDRPPNSFDSRITWFYKKTNSPAYRSADLVLALSPYMEKLAIKNGALPETVKVIPNGVAIDEINSKQSLPRKNQSSDVLKLLYAGRLAIEKGVDLLLAACMHLKTSNIAFQLRIAGDGPEQQRLQSIASENDLLDCVHFLGPIPRKDMGKIYSESDIVCVPSRSDILPTVVLEAMCCGIPVVGANTGGIPFMVTHEVTGLIHDLGDPKSIADAIIRLNSDSDLLESMQTKAQEDVRERFAWSSIGKNIATELESVIEKRKSLS